MEAEEFDCALCLQMLCRPVTTVCGHSFCKTCLLACIGHQEKCPICRSVLPFHATESSMPVNVLLEKVLETQFGKAYESRKAEQLQEAADRAVAMSPVHGSPTAGSAVVPVFVLDSILPRQKIGLNVFEPRYVLMVERCLQSSRRFGMIGVQHASQHGHGHAPVVADYGTEVEITEIKRAGGRFELMVVGRRSFKIVDRWLQDGYIMARVEWLTFEDEAALALPNELDQSALMEQSSRLETAVNSWMELVRAGGWERNSRHIDSILEDLGPMPPKEKPNDRAMWVAALINPLPSLGLAPEIRPMVLSAESCRTRLGVVSEALRESMQYIQPSKTNLALQRMFAGIGITPSQPLLRCLLAMLPWVVVAIGLMLRGLVFPETEAAGAAEPPPDAANPGTTTAGVTADVVQNLAADW